MTRVTKALLIGKGQSKLAKQLSAVAKAKTTAALRSYVSRKKHDA